MRKQILRYAAKLSRPSVLCQDHVDISLSAIVFAKTATCVVSIKEVKMNQSTVV